MAPLTEKVRPRQLCVRPCQQLWRLPGVPDGQPSRRQTDDQLAARAAEVPRLESGAAAASQGRHADGQRQMTALTDVDGGDLAVEQWQEESESLQRVWDRYRFSGWA